MVSLTQVPIAAANAAFTLLYLTKLESGEVLAAFLCLAIAHRAHVTGGLVSKAEQATSARGKEKRGDTTTTAKTHSHTHTHTHTRT